MKIYNRHNIKKIISLRLLFLILISLASFSNLHENWNLFYFLVVFLIFTSLIIVSNFESTGSSFKITKYYFFGFIKFHWNFTNKDKLTINSSTTFEDSPEITDGGDPYDFGTLYGCLYPLFSKVKIGKIRFRISSFDEKGKIKSHVYVFLNYQEYKIANDIAANKHAI